MITNTYTKVFVTYVTRQHRHGRKATSVKDKC